MNNPVVEVLTKAGRHGVIGLVIGVALFLGGNWAAIGLAKVFEAALFVLNNVGQVFAGIISAIGTNYAEHPVILVAQATGAGVVGAMLGTANAKLQERIKQNVERRAKEAEGA